MRSSPANCYQWLKCHCQSPLMLLKNFLGGAVIGGIKVKLIFFLLDWTLDIGTASYHFANQRWIEATLTYLIVLGSGIVTTFGYLRYPDIRSFVARKAKEIGTIWQIFLFIPTFLPFVLGRIWLNSEVDCEMTALQHEDGDEASKTKLIEEHEKIKDLSLKAFWLETILESKPQALLQTLFLLETTQGFNSILDFLPVLLSIWSMYSMTNSIYELVAATYKDKTETYSKLYGNTYTALSILAPVMIVNILRDRFSSNLEIFLATLITLVVYYLTFEIVYQITYFISNLLFKNDKSRSWHGEEADTERNRHTKFSRLYQVVVLLLFSSCVFSWDFLSQIAAEESMKRMTIVSVFPLLLIGNAVAFVKAEAFVVESFRLKNVKIDNSWKSLRATLQNCLGQTDEAENQIN